MNLLNFFDVLMVMELLKWALSLNLTISHDHNVICKVNEINCMSCKDSGLFAHKAHKNLIKNSFSDVSIKSTNWIIHDQDIRLLVYRSCQSYPSFLTTWKINTFFTYFSLVSCLHESKIRLQLASTHCLNVPALIKLTPEQDDISKLTVLNPSLLLAITRCAPDFNRGSCPCKVFRQEFLLKSAQLCIW